MWAIIQLIDQYCHLAHDTLSCPPEGEEKIAPVTIQLRHTAQRCGLFKDIATELVFYRSFPYSASKVFWSEGWEVGGSRCMCSFSLFS